MLITDVKRIISKGTKNEYVQTGYYMQGYLVNNLNPIPNYLKKEWDVIGIVSGHGKVGIGKCLKKGSKALMFNGFWKNVEDIKLGDEVLSPQENSSVTCEKVIGIHNRFEEDCYNVIEESTKRILYSCAGNHEIPVFKNNLKKGKYDLKIMEAKEISKYSGKSKNQFYCLSSPCINFKNEFNPKIDPYTLGVWLGDGSFSSYRKLNKNYKGNKISYTKGYSRIVNGKKINHNGHLHKRKVSYGKNGFYLSRSITITSNDPEVIKKISEYEEFINVHEKQKTSAKSYRYSINGKLAKELIKYNLEGKNSGNKFVPKECLLASKEFRWKLLAGLIDADGYCTKNNSIIFTTKSKNLAENVRELVFSLGGFSFIRKIRKEIKKIGFIGDYFNVRISFTDNNKIPLQSKFKKQRMNKSSFNRNHIYIKCVKSKPSKVYGFTISGKSKWHITDNWMITHNSTMAMQVGYYLAWLLAGGEMILSKDGKKALGVKSPKEKVKFDLKENVVFSAEALQETALKLYNKYGKKQVIIYDEGRQGLESARAMEFINKGMSDFFQECRFMSHVIIIVLPNFFKLHEDYAVARSLFLIDVFADKNFNRGYFNFYNEKQKELLHFFGKKRIGVTARYMSANESFWGKFGKWMPFDKDEYDQVKKEEIDKKRVLRRERNLQLQRDTLVFILQKHLGIPYKEIKQKMYEVSNFEIGERTLNTCVERINDVILKGKGY